MSLGLVVVVFLAIMAPHVVRIDDAPPPIAVVVWLSALCLRALAGISVALLLVVYLPTTQLFGLMTHWCWHTILPGFTAHLGFSGHELGDAAVIAPMLALGASFVSVAFGLWRATRAVRAWLRGSRIGPGPDRSVVVKDSGVVVAAAGILKPTIVVSAGALTVLDDDELAAGLAHERGHVARRHRFVLMLGEVCRALGRPMPGTRQATAELAFHLERDADDWAVARQCDPTALASAICKAAQSGSSGVVFALAGRDGIARRVRRLLAGDRVPGSQRAISLLAAAMAGLVVLIGSVLPVATLAQASQFDRQPVAHTCPA